MKIINQFNVLALTAALLAVGARAAVPANTLNQALAKVSTMQGHMDENKRFNQFLAVHWNYIMQDNPEFATAVGHPGFDDRWKDVSLQAVERRHRDAKKFLQALKTINRKKLSAKEQVNYDVFMSITERDIRGQKFPEHFLAVGPMHGPQQQLSADLEQAPRKSVKDYENLLARLRKIPVVLTQTTEVLREGVRNQVTPAKVTMFGVANQIKNQIPDKIEDAPLLLPFKEFPSDIDAQAQARIKSEATKIYKDSVAPAFSEFHKFFMSEYLPKCRETIGLSDLKDGQAWYQHQIEYFTTTKMNAEQVHELGLSEVKRIRGEMDKLIADLKFNGGFKEFTKFLRTDKQFFFNDKEELLKNYRDISKRIDPELPKLFGRLPRLPYGVVPVPTYSEQNVATAYYQPGSLKAGRAGYFFANTYDLAGRPKWEMEALTAHEAVPGHHFQIALSEEMEDLPKFRQYGFGSFTAFVEGWGLYAESLGDDLGLYKNAYSKFGKLSYEIWRSIRLVVDTGMHAKGWTRDQAIQFFEANSSASRHNIEVEVDRYISWPGQALAYKIGELKFKALKAHSKVALGDKFDIRKFHDVLLQDGALPLALVEKNVDNWIFANTTRLPSSKGL